MVITFLYEYYGPNGLCSDWGQVFIEIGPAGCEIIQEKLDT